MIAEPLVFLVQLNAVLAAAVLIVLALRHVTRAQFGARIAYRLWWIVPIVLVALMLPARTIETVTEAVTPPRSTTTVAVSETTETAPRQPTTASIDVSSILLGIWILGSATMLLVLSRRQRAFIASLGRLSRDATGAWRAEANCAGPMVVGALWPKLVLPKDFETQFDQTERDLMLAHERVHLRRGDARINGLAALMQCACWFNPFVYVAAFAMRVDQELACDATVAEWYPKTRRAYAEAMLKAQAVPMNLPVGCAWSARDAHPLKVRIEMLKRDLPDRRRAAIGSRLAALVCLTCGFAAWASQPPRETSTQGSVVANALLQHAVLWGDARLAEVALRSGADPNVRTVRGMTVLTMAARAEDMRILNVLLAHGADVHLRSKGEGNALVAAGRRGHLRAVTALVEHGATINEVVPDYGTPLGASVRTGHFAVVKYLVEHGADVNLPSPPPAPWDRWGNTSPPLRIAVDGSHRATAEYLRSAGATM